jgi:putative membrane-bound dehydrogenase-like protein
MIRLLFAASLSFGFLASLPVTAQQKQDVAALAASKDLPKNLDPSLKLNLVAIEPKIVTPTGITVDEAGRIWVIENHTHQRPKDYAGPSSDRIRVFEDFDETGKARRVSTFAEGFRNSMGLTLGLDGSVYLATRSAIYRLRDTKGAGHADEQKVIVRLDTKAVYPHNGLSGFTWDALGRLYFGFGENEGLAYQLVGSDGRTLAGGGEGGSIYRCRPDGAGLTRVATGFWNPFALAFDAFGRLFAVDNDPDSRGPCRLLHIVEGGDYGYRYRNGRKGLHPFTAWNGELPGTLPMVAGTGEAPSGILAYEGDALPPPYRGRLLNTSWGDHVIERFELLPKGASFTARSHDIIRGGEYFRPVGMALAPDGSCVMSDWCDKSYPVHGKGRIWRLSPATPEQKPVVRADRLNTLTAEELGRLLRHPRQTVRNEAGRQLARKGADGVRELEQALLSRDEARTRVQGLWGLVQAGDQVDWPRLRPLLLEDASGEVRAEAVARLGEQGLLRDALADKQFRQRLLQDPDAQVRMQTLLQLDPKNALDDLLQALTDPDSFLVSAAENALGKPGASSLLLPHIADARASVRKGVLIALRRSGDVEGRSALTRYLKDADPSIRAAAIQWVAEDGLREFEDRLQASAAESPVTRELFESLLAARQILAEGYRNPRNEVAGQDYVAAVVATDTQPAAFRALGLSLLKPDHATLTPTRLLQLLSDKDPSLRQETVRTLRLRTDAPAQDLLRNLAADRSKETALRADAANGLAGSITTPETQRVLVDLLKEPQLARDALRSLRGATLPPNLEANISNWWNGYEQKKSPAGREIACQLALHKFNPRIQAHQARMKALLDFIPNRPTDAENWQRLANEQGDARTGERIFFQAEGPRCYVCHRVGGRGGNIGPDLTTIGAALSTEKLVDSILTPSREIAPQYANWLIATRDGKVHSGVIVEEGFNSTVTLADNQGKLTVIPRTQIDERRALPGSIMPDNLTSLLTPQDWTDLIAFLKRCK